MGSGEQLGSQVGEPGRNGARYHSAKWNKGTTSLKSRKMPCDKDKEGRQKAQNSKNTLLGIEKVYF